MQKESQLKENKELKQEPKRKPNDKTKYEPATRFCLHFDCLKKICSFFCLVFGVIELLLLIYLQVSRPSSRLFKENDRGIDKDVPMGRLLQRFVCSRSGNIVSINDLRWFSIGRSAGITHLRIITMLERRASNVKAILCKPHRH